MKSIRRAGLIGVLGVFLVYSAAWVTAAAPEKRPTTSKELVFESDVKKAKEDRLKAPKEKYRKERKPLTEEERKKRYQESISRRHQQIIDKQEALVARCMKIRALAQQEKAMLTIKEIDKLITEQREQIKVVKQQMQDALHPEQARQRRMAEKQKMMQAKRAKYEADRERKIREKKIKREQYDKRKDF